MRARYSLARSTRSVLAGLLTLAAFAGPALAQAAYTPAFDVEVVTQRAQAAAGPETRVDVYTAVPNTSLRFLAAADGFEASYAVTVQVYALDADGTQQGLVVSRTFERDVTADDYDATQDADREDRAVQTLAVAPGRYVVEVAVEDGSSGRSLTREVGHVVRDLAQPGVTLSDPLLLSDYDPAAGSATPIVGATVSTEDAAFWVSYDLYAPAPTALQVTYVVTEQSRVRERPSFGALLGLAPRQQADLGTPVAVTEPLEVEAGRTPAAFRIETEALQVGDYTLTIRLATADGTTLATADKRFAVRWMGLDSQIADLDQAIDQLRYVAKDDELRAIRNAPTPEEQRRLFLSFWDRRDPTPGTNRNEQMEEYYFRVAYANERYSRFHDRGWNTDRGEIFIRFGEPDYVEDHPFNYGTRPYQIWSYYGQGRRFIFVDESGMGDFRLLIPHWDDRTRM
ncbi:GWxTD domain-containing protein [Rubrivirga sp.]|uniref:GWxTD domain-containing protein n=1 Tax=Rubrivirga sp. TaxID=1885344 RepID=UPI003B51FF91